MKTILRIAFILGIIAWSFKSIGQIDYKANGIDTTRNELGSLKLSKVFEYKDSTLTKDVLFSRVNEFIQKIYVSGKDVKSSEDKAEGKYICEGITQNFKWMGGCNAGNFKYKMIVYVKDKKAKVIFENIMYQKGECPSEARSGADYGDTFPSTWGTIAKKFDTKKYAEMKEQAFKEFLLIINYFDKINSSGNKDKDF